MVGREGRVGQRKVEWEGYITFFACGVQIYGFEEVVHGLKRRRGYLHGEVGGGEVLRWIHL